MMKKLKPSFHDYELEPSPQVWMKIVSRLDDIPETKRGWLFFSLAAIAIAAVAVFITLLYDVDIHVKPKQHESKEFISKSSTQTGENKISSLHESSPAVGNETSSLKNNFSGVEKTGAGIKGEGDHRQSTVNRLQTTNSKRMIANSNKHALFSSSAKNTEPVQPNTESGHLPANHMRAYTEKMELIDPFTFPHVQELAISTAYANPDDRTFLKKSSLSRWEVSLASAYEYNYRMISFATGKTSITERDKNYLKNETGIYSPSFSVSAGYHLSTHFSIATGVNYFSAGQERNRFEVTPNDTTSTNSLYAVSTSAGNVIGSNQQLDEAYHSSYDSVVVSLLANPGSSASGNSVLLDLKFRQQFYFISIPVSIRYQTAERRFTPYIGLGFSIGYLVREKVLLSDRALDDREPGNLHRFLFSAEAQAGIKCKAGQHFSISLQPSLRYGLNSISSSDRVKWIPYAWGIGAGLNYRF